MSDEIIHESGPIFDGRAEEAAKQAVDRIEQKLAEVARDRARDIQIAKIKVDRGFEPGSLHVAVENGHRLVTDLHSIVYGPWLEGTGSRNSVTRFRGYHALRAAASEVNAEAKRISEDELKPYLREMN